MNEDCENAMHDVWEYVRMCRIYLRRANFLGKGRDSEKLELMEHAYTNAMNVCAVLRTTILKKKGGEGR